MAPAGAVSAFSTILTARLSWAAAMGILALAILVGAVAAPARAQGTGQSVYVASGIPVEVTGDAATLRDQAVIKAQRDGLRQVLKEIAPADQVEGLLLPSDDEIGSWVTDLAIDEEKIAATRYIGRYTIRFAAAPVQEFLSREGIAFAETRARQMLMLPVYTDEAGTTGLWGPTNAWARSWAQPQNLNSALVPVVTPRGDLDDQNILTATDALAGAQAKLQFMAERYQAGDVVVAEAQMSAPGADGNRSLALDVTRYGQDGIQRYQDTLTGAGGDPDGLLAQGVATVQQMLEGAWKVANLVDPNKRTRIAVHVPLTSLQQWVAIKQRLAQVNLVKTVDLKQLARSGAELEIGYAGDEAQFIRALAVADLFLVSSGEGMSTLTMGGAGANP
ncbi:uncharacterized protein DUF2066 [Dongia mobilis]|uniref:Uncharacterized protein DUF2066 n=2 Tax=Dongia mobilis TaxID=578943 RepID=A0A4R6WF97_9PROT|nr:uncharacterized protein DUF2066 [Dongia mobilis]